MSGGSVPTGGASAAGNAAATNIAQNPKMLQALMAAGQGMKLMNQAHPMAAALQPQLAPMGAMGAGPVQMGGLLGAPHPQLPQMGAPPPMQGGVSVPQMNQALEVKNGFFGGF